MATLDSLLSKHEAHLIAKAYHLLPQRLSGYVERHQQKDMIRCVAQTLAASSHAVIQAPTGTGKSFGYQIPAIVLGASRDKRVIISTKTANLQTQIADKDLKILSDIFSEIGIEASSAVIMGRERYVCPLRLTEKTQQGSLLDEDNSQEVMREVADA